MSRSLKLKNNDYWDSKGIVHKKGLLSDKIDVLDSNATYEIENLSSNAIRWSLKYDNGTLICGGKIYKDIINQDIIKQGEVYKTNLYFTDVYYKTPFIEAPTITVTVAYTDTSIVFGCILGVELDKEKIKHIEMLRGDVGSGVTVLNYIAVGQWK